MSAGTRSSAITAQAPLSSAILAWEALTTSIITPPLSICARPALTAKEDWVAASEAVVLVVGLREVLGEVEVGSLEGMLEYLVEVEE